MSRKLYYEYSNEMSSVYCYSFKITAKNKIHFSKTRVTFIAIIIIYLLRVALMCILGL